MISSVITHSPKCKVATAALIELRTACDLFEAAASYGGRAIKFLVSVLTSTAEVRSSKLAWFHRVVSDF